HGVQFFANHDDTKLLIEVYVQPSAASHPSKNGLEPALSLSKGEAPISGAPSVQECQPFATALHSALPQVAGVVVFQTSAIEDKAQQRAPLTAIHPEASQAIGDGSLMYHAVGHDYRVSGGSFFQTNRHLVDDLVKTATGGVTGKAALDLYAGIGLFTAALAANFEDVLAVEASPHAFGDLKHNA